MKQKKNVILIFLKGIGDDISCLRMVLSERGLLFVLRPILIGGVVFTLLYTQIYEQGNKAILLKKDAIEAKRIQSENMENYLRDKARFDFFLKHMPKMEDKSSWLLDIVSTMLEENKVKTTKISEQKEEKKNNFIMATISISATMSYQELGEVLQSIENNDIFLKVVSLDVVKSVKGILGYNEVNMSISTIFYSPKKVEVL